MRPRDNAAGDDIGRGYIAPVRGLSVVLLDRSIVMLLADAKLTLYEARRQYIFVYPYAVHRYRK